MTALRRIESEDTARRIQRVTTRALSLAMLVIGVALIVQAFARHGGPTFLRLLLGVLFVAAGVGRLYLLSRRGGSVGAGAGSVGGGAGGRVDGVSRGPGDRSAGGSPGPGGRSRRRGRT